MDSVEDEDVGDYINTDKGEISLDSDNADYKKHKKYDVYKVTVSEEDTRKITISAGTDDQVKRLQNV